MEENKIKLEDLTWRTFESEADLAMIMSMMTRDLSEPYPIYTYRFFVQQWPELTLLAYHKGKCLGCVVSKLDVHKKNKIGE
jgi:peptide alpha-N-acetyltransferase